MKEETTVAEAPDIQDLFNQQNKSLAAATEARLADFTEKVLAAYRLDGGPKKPADLSNPTKPGTEVAVVGDSGIMGVVKGVQIVPVAGGMFVAVFASEIVDGFMSKQSVQMRGFAKLGVAAGALYASHKWGSKVPLLGSAGLKVVALLVAFDGVRNLVPQFGPTAQGLATKVTHVATTAGLALDGSQRPAGIPSSSMRTSSQMMAGR